MSGSASHRARVRSRGSARGTAARSPGNRTTAKLGALLTSQQQFVADASHQLRSPLTALRLRVESGETGAALAETDRLARVVDELLALARADTAGEPTVEVPLGALAARRVEMWQALAAERGVRLTAVDEGAVVRAGALRVEQVLDNLLSNAMDASPKGGRSPSLPLGRELRVLDEGIGMSGEQLERAFDRFWRKGKGTGSGLGLAIARRAGRARRRIDRAEGRAVRRCRSGRPLSGQPMSPLGAHIPRKPDR